MDDVDDLESGDADDSSSSKGADGLRKAELKHENVADEHGDDALDSDDGKQLLRCVEHDGEAACRKCCCNRLIEVGIRRLDVYVGDVVHACHEDGKGDAEGHAADDEHGIHPARHARCGEAIEHVACCIDRRKAGHEKDGTRDERVPHGAKSERHRDRPCAECGDKAGNHSAGIGIEGVTCARSVCDEACKCGDGGDECLEPAAAEELA